MLRSLLLFVTLFPWSTVVLATALPAPVLALLTNLFVAYAPSILGAAVVALCGLVARLVVRIRGGAARHAALALTDAGRLGALFVEAKVAPALRGADGKLDPEAAQKAKTAGLAAAMEYLSTHGLEDIKAALGKTDAELEEDLGLKVELGAASLGGGNAITPDRTVVTLPSGRRLVVGGS